MMSMELATYTASGDTSRPITGCRPETAAAGLHIDCPILQGGAVKTVSATHR